MLDLIGHAARIAVVIALAGMQAAYAQGETHPGKPVQVVLPLQAGSGSDVAFR